MGYTKVLLGAAAAAVAFFAKNASGGGIHQLAYHIAGFAFAASLALMSIGIMGGGDYFRRHSICKYSAGYFCASAALLLGGC